MQAKTEAAAARQEVQASKVDNVALVERLHYVQGYQRTGRRKGKPKSTRPESCTCVALCTYAGM